MAIGVEVEEEEKVVNVDFLVTEMEKKEKIIITEKEERIWK